MIEVELEPEDIPGWWGLERCCFCRAQTKYWHTGNDVACCQECAAVHDEVDLPTKKEWIEKETSLRQTFFNPAR